MGKVDIGSRQGLIDIALQESGKAEDAWLLAEKLGVDLTDEVEGMSVDIAGEHLFGKSEPLGTRPASEPTEGIGYWRIGHELRVS